MTHTDALNLILANCCSNPAPHKGEDVLMFDIELHCMQVTVYAKLVSTMNAIQYEIVSLEIGS